MVHVSVNVKLQHSNRSATAHPAVYSIHGDIMGMNCGITGYHHAIMAVHGYLWCYDEYLYCDHGFSWC